MRTGEGCVDGEGDAVWAFGGFQGFLGRCPSLRGERLKYELEKCKFRSTSGRS